MTRTNREVYTIFARFCVARTKREVHAFVARSCVASGDRDVFHMFCEFLPRPLTLISKALNPKLETFSPKLETLNPKLETLNLNLKPEAPDTQG